VPEVKIIVEITRKKMIRGLLILILTAVICLCGYELWKISGKYVHEEQIRKSIEKYRPTGAATEINQIWYGENIFNDDGNVSSAETDETGEYNSTTEARPNQFVANLGNEINMDIVGWLSIPETKIDYPFAQAHNNDYYLRRDVYGNYAAAGTLFMDHRCANDFTGSNTIIYGHTMRNGTMFGELSLFDDEGFFDVNRYGTIYLKDQTYTIKFFAYMIVTADDGIIYNPSPETDEYYEYVKRFARNYREPQTGSGIVTLSTCSYENDGARNVMLGNIRNKKRLVEEENE